MFFKVFCFFLLPFLANGIYAKFCVNNFNYDFNHSSNNIRCDNLYDPDIMSLYNNSQNEPQLYLDNKFAPMYFKNLTTNFGENKYESCGYIAMGMLLSFWDTYWDDNIIDETYEATAILNDAHRIVDGINSPGIVSEQTLITNVDKYTYYNYIDTYKSTYFHFLLLSLGISLFNIGPDNYGIYDYQYNQILSAYLNGYKGYTNSEVSITTTYVNVRQTAISYIQIGIPVILNLSNHAVVAYDYDEDEDNIYCHFGWGAKTVHVTPESLGYNYFASVVAIDFDHFQCSHVHSNNYHYIDNSNEIHYVCPCSLTIPTEIMVIDKLYLDQPPTFKWNSIYGKWFLNEGIYYDFSILSYNNYVIYHSDIHIYDNYFEMDMDDYLDVLSYSGNSFRVLITIGSLPGYYWDDYSCSQLFVKPDIYKNKTQIKPNEWGFDNRYYFANEGIKYSTITKNGLTISTSRLRCGYIEDSYVVLSPRRANAGTSYFELSFNVPVYSFLYSVCLWSANEDLDGTAILQTRDENGVWATQVDLLNDITLRNKTQGIDRYVIQCSTGVYGLRFQTTATATGDRNKGRLCIDDLVFSLSSGTSNNTYSYTSYPKTSY